MAEVERGDSLFNSASCAGIPAGPWLDRILSEVEAILRVNPEAGAEIEAPGLRVIYTAPFPPSVPPFAVVYSYDGQTCRLLAIRRALRPGT